MKNHLYKSKKIKSFTLTELLVVMVIIGILTFLAVPKLMPLITKARGKEAETNLGYIQRGQTEYKMEHVKFTSELEDIDFEMPANILEDPENGTAYYEYQITESSTSSFTATATAVVDFDDDGVFNKWEISETGKAKEIVKD